MKVSDILRVKGGTLYTVSPDQRLADAVTTMAELEIAPLSPAASANGTVRPSAMPMTMSRTISPEVKCRSTWWVCGMGAAQPAARHVLRGLRCAAAGQGHPLTAEFGQPHLEGRQPQALIGLGDHGIEALFVDHPLPRKNGLPFYGRLAANLLSPLPYSVASHASAELRQAVIDFAAKHEVDLWHCEWTPYAQTMQKIY